MSQRKAVTKAVATRYRRANRSRKKPRDGTDLDVSDEVAAALVVMSPATMNRRLAADRAAMTLRGRSHTKPGSLLKDAIPIRTWAQWDDAVPRVRRDRPGRP